MKPANSCHRYNRYLSVAARVVRRSLKEDLRIQAERRGEMDLRFAKWEVRGEYVLSAMLLLVSDPLGLPRCWKLFLSQHSCNWQRSNGKRLRMLTLFRMASRVKTKPWRRGMQRQWRKLRAVRHNNESHSLGIDGAGS